MTVARALSRRSVIFALISLVSARPGWAGTSPSGPDYSLRDSFAIDWLQKTRVQNLRGTELTVRADFTLQVLRDRIDFPAVQSRSGSATIECWLAHDLLQDDDVAVPKGTRYRVSAVKIKALVARKPTTQVSISLVAENFRAPVRHLRSVECVSSSALPAAEYLVATQKLFQPADILEWIPKASPYRGSAARYVESLRTVPLGELKNQKLTLRVDTTLEEKSESVRFPMSTFGYGVLLGCVLHHETLATQDVVVPAGTEFTVGDVTAAPYKYDPSATIYVLTLKAVDPLSEGRYLRSAICVGTSPVFIRQFLEATGDFFLPELGR